MKAHRSIFRAHPHSNCNYVHHITTDRRRGFSVPESRLELFRNILEDADERSLQSYLTMIKSILK